MTNWNVIVGVGVGVAAVAAGVTVAVLRGREKAGRMGHDRFDEELLNTPAIEPEVIDVTSADGTRLRVHAYGPADAAPIVLSHGWVCNIDYWYPQINALAGDYRVIAYDQRGHGGSEIGTARFSTDVLADDLAAVLAATVSADRPAVIAGHSMGGMSVLAWAARYPEQVRRYAGAVLLANTGAHRLVADTKLIPLVSIIELPPIAGRIVLGAPVKLPHTAVSRAVFRSRVMSRAASAEQVDFAARIIFGCPARVRGRWGAVLSGLDLRAAFDHLDVPTSVLAGERDNLTPPVHSERLAQALERAGALDTFEVIPAIGHLSNVEASQRFNEELVRLAKRAHAAQTPELS